MCKSFWTLWRQKMFLFELCGVSKWRFLGKSGYRPLWVVVGACMKFRKLRATTPAWILVEQFSFRLRNKWKHRVMGDGCGHPKWDWCEQNTGWDDLCAHQCCCHWLQHQLSPSDICSPLLESVLILNTDFFLGLGKINCNVSPTSWIPHCEQEWSGADLCCAVIKLCGH